MTITGGVVEYSRLRKPADFESQSARVSFNINEGDNIAAEVAGALDMAVAQVHRVLGLATPVPTQGTTEPTKNKGGRPRKDTTTASSTASASSTPAPAGVSEKSVSADPADMPQIRTNPEDRKDPADMGDEFNEPAPRQITDAELKEACGKKAAAFTAAGVTDGSAKIKELIAKKTGGVARYAEIPVPARAGFLTELEALK